VSTDGKLIATADVGCVQVWDSRSHEAIGTTGRCCGSVRSVCFSPDSRWLVSGSSDKRVQMWDCRTLLAIGSPLLGHTGLVCSVCTDGQKIVSGSGDQTIRIWSCDTHKLIGEPVNTGGCVRAVSLSKGGRIAAGVDHDVCIFDIETRQEVALMKGHTDCVLTVAFSPDGSRIASGSYTSIRIWDVQTGKETLRLEGHTDIPRSVAFSPDGQWLASGSEDRTVRVWDSETGSPRHDSSITRRNMATNLLTMPINHGSS